MAPSPTSPRRRASPSWTSPTPLHPVVRSSERSTGLPEPGSRQEGRVRLPGGGTGRDTGHRRLRPRRPGDRRECVKGRHRLRRRRPPDRRRRVRDHVRRGTLRVGHREPGGARPHANPRHPALARRLCPLPGGDAEPPRNGSAQAVGVSAAGNVVSRGRLGLRRGLPWDSTNPLHLTFRGTHRAAGRVPGGGRRRARRRVLPRHLRLEVGRVHRAAVPAHGPSLPAIYPPNLRRPAARPCTNAERCDFVPSSVPLDGGGIGFSGKYVFYAAPAAMASWASSTRPTRGIW